MTRPCSQAMIAVLVSVLCAMLWLFTGVEVIHREHDTDYVVFAKQHATLRVLYTNPVLCGECDVKPLDKLDDAQRLAFGAFCRARFGLNDIRQCHAIYAEAQRIATDNWPRQ